MASPSEIARRYFAALGARDLDAAVACWAPGAVDRLVGAQELIAPDGIRRYFGALFAAFPDFELEVLEVTAGRGRAAVRWRAHGTFAGPGDFQGFVANGAAMTLEGCDVVTVRDDLIQHNDAYLDSGDVARQLGLLPAAGSRAEARLTKLANARTQVLAKINGVDTEPIADRVFVVRGGFPIKTMNVYLIEDGDGVVVFDAGTKAMGRALRVACARLGGAKRRRPQPRRRRPPGRCARARRAGLLPSGRACGGRVARPMARLLGPREARSLRPRAAAQVAAKLGRRRGRRAGHGHRWQTRSPAFAWSICPDTRPG